MGPGLQREGPRALAPALKKAKVKADISAMDETNPGTFATNWNAYSQADRDLVDQMNVHTYGTEAAHHRAGPVQGRGQTPWMSEVGGDQGDGQTFEDMRPASASPSRSSTICGNWSRAPGCSGSPSRTTTT